MTEYSEAVELVRQKTAADAWGKQVNYIHATNGVMEICYNNGNKEFQDTSTGDTYWEYKSTPPWKLVDAFNRFLADRSAMVRSFSWKAQPKEK
jgi:hypothetical protein